MAAQTQKAMIYEETGKKLVFGERPIPTPGANQVLVKVMSAGINPVDWKIIKYGIFVNKFPAILGTDIAGVVEKVGAEVKDFKVGDRVIYQGNYEIPDSTGFQQYSVRDATLIGKLPPNVDFDHATTIPVASAAALVGLFSSSGLGLPLPNDIAPGSKPSQNTHSILIMGGASNVGQFALQFARIAGFEHIITTASPKNKDLCLSLGATHFFDRSDVDAAKKIKKLFGEDLKYAFDAISTEETQKTALEAMADSHPVYMTTVLPTLNDKNGFSKKPKSSESKAIFGSFQMHPDIAVPFLKAVESLLASNKLKTPQVEVVGGLKEVNEGLDKLEAGNASALKYIIRPQE